MFGINPRSTITHEIQCYIHFEFRIARKNEHLVTVGDFGCYQKFKSV